MKMDDFLNFFNQNSYTPEEIAQMKAYIQNLKDMAGIQNNGVNLGLNVAQLPPMTGLGFLIGNLGANWYRNYKQRGVENKAREYESLENQHVNRPQLPNLINLPNNQWYKTAKNPQNNTYFDFGGREKWR